MGRRAAAILVPGALVIGAGVALRLRLQGSAPQLVAERVLPQGLQAGSRLYSSFQEADSAQWVSLNDGSVGRQPLSLFDWLQASSSTTTQLHLNRITLP